MIARTLAERNQYVTGFVSEWARLCSEGMAPKEFAFWRGVLADTGGGPWNWRGE